MRRSAICALCCALVVSAGLALADDKPVLQVTNRTDRGEVEKAAYLGVATTPVEPTLAAQLGLPAGVGLVVEYVDAQSPAGKLLQQHDILKKLNDQILVNHEQLAVLVRLQKSGEVVKLTFLRKGQEKEVEVTLAEKDLPKLRARQSNAPRIFFGPPEIPNLKMWMNGNDGANDFPDFPPMPGDQPPPPPPGNSSPAPGIKGTKQSTHLRIAPGAGGIQTRSMAVVGDHGVNVLNEGGRSYQLTTDGRSKRLVVKEGEKVIFDGPVTTVEERQKLPADIIDKLTGMEGLKKETKPARLVPDGKLL